MRSRGPVGWPARDELQGSESASTAATRAGPLARPASAPVLHLDLHRFAPSAKRRLTAELAAQPTALAHSATLAPPATRRERTVQPQSASFKHKTTLSFAAPGTQPSSAQPRGSVTVGGAADDDEHRFARFGPRKSHTPMSDRWLELSQAPRQPVQRDVARKYAHGSRESRGSHSSFFRGCAAAP